MKSELHNAETAPPLVSSSIQIIRYNESYYEEKNTQCIDDCFSLEDDHYITWINIESTKHFSELEKLATHFAFHPLLLDDITGLEQRPKLDDYGNHIYMITSMLDYNINSMRVDSEQLSLILGKNYVISIQENGKEGDVFNPIREKLRTSKGKIRRMGADYLLYSMMDIVVDNYFTIIEKIGERVEDIETSLITDPTPNTLRRLYGLKREMINLRKAVWPLREVVSKLERLDSELITDFTVLYIKDVYDHTVQVIETIESFRDILSGLLDIYLSSMSNKMNAVMKVLTIISTIFMPLSFIVGLYGMNFHHFPELDWYYGYYAVLGLCFSVAIGMLVFFRKRKWI
jgi:magnesium transporter